MSAAFLRAVNFTLEHEGGYSLHPKDPGGETNFGISKRAYPDLDIKALTREQAVEIYRRDYWMPAMCEVMPGPVATAHFDCAVNSGLRRAALIFQASIGAIRDGKLGLETLSQLEIAMRKQGAVVVASGLIQTRVRFLIEIAQNKQEWTFLRGWMVRCLDLAVEVSQMAGPSAHPPQKEPTTPHPGSSGSP